MPKSKKTNAEGLLGAAEARKFLGISQPTYYRWLKESRLQGTKVGGRWRFHRETLEDLLRSSNTGEPTTDVFEEAESMCAVHLQQAGFNQKKIQTLRTDLHKDDPASVMVLMLLEHAITREASDLDIVPVADGVEIRERIDSVLCSLKPLLPATCLRPLAASLKNRAGLEPITLTPQHGRFEAQVDGRRIEARLSTYPTSRGESLSLRLLDPKRIILELDKLGFNRDVENDVRDAITHSKGVLFINGPTDVGKSTTLYSLIESRKMAHLKIMTIEDPVEFRLDGVLQAETSDKLDFETAMRAMVRSNLDVGMVSEMRTPEAIKLLFTMAHTGHLMLSVLHAHCGVSAISTILEIGAVEPRLVCDNLLGILTQRLLPRLCADCCRERSMSRESAQRLSLKGADRHHKVFVRKGCKNCNGTGIKGRVLANEWLPLTAKLRDVILSDHPTSENLRTALRDDFQDLRHDVLTKLRAGEVDTDAALSALT